MHKSVAVKLVHELTSPRWRDGGDGEVVWLDEEGRVEAEIRLGAPPGRRKVGQNPLSFLPPFLVLLALDDL